MIMQNDPDKVPLFKSWQTWYGVVIVSLILLVTFFYVFTKYFE